jgi:hypothetical protein
MQRCWRQSGVGEGCLPVVVVVPRVDGSAVVVMPHKVVRVVSAVGVDLK